MSGGVHPRPQSPRRASSASLDYALPTSPSPTPPVAPFSPVLRTVPAETDSWCSLCCLYPRGLCPEGEGRDGRCAVPHTAGLLAVRKGLGTSRIALRPECSPDRRQAATIRWRTCGPRVRTAIGTGARSRPLQPSPVTSPGLRPTSVPRSDLDLQHQEPRRCAQGRLSARLLGSLAMQHRTPAQGRGRVPSRRGSMLAIPAPSGKLFRQRPKGRT